MSSVPDKKYSFLVDVNLPKRFIFFNQPAFTHIVDINPQMPDEEIWDYALKENKVILTKDTDFYEKSISSENKPKVIFFQLGNLTLKELHDFFDKNWGKIVEHLDKSDLIIVNKEKVKVIS